jgi:hypothetical protein
MPAFPRLSRPRLIRLSQPFQPCQPRQSRPRSTARRTAKPVSASPASPRSSLPCSASPGTSTPRLARVAFPYHALNCRAGQGLASVALVAHHRQTPLREARPIQTALIHARRCTTSPALQLLLRRINRLEDRHQFDEPLVTRSPTIRLTQRLGQKHLAPPRVAHHVCETAIAVAFLALWK